MHILVVTKVTALQRFNSEPMKYAFVADDTLTRAKISAAAHDVAYQKLLDLLSEHYPDSRIVNVAQLDHLTIRDVRLVITLGGDGTLLTASHYVPDNIPVIAINSDPHRSFGNFCSWSIDDTEALLSTFSRDQKELEVVTVAVSRMRVKVDGEVVADRILNEALFSHTCPAAMTRFKLLDQRTSSSGIWISTGAGSTGAVSSAGGVKMSRNNINLQAVVREPWDNESRDLWSKPKLARTFTLTSKIADAMLYFDGPFLTVPVGIDQEVVFEVSPHSLNLVEL